MWRAALRRVGGVSRSRGVVPKRSGHGGSDAWNTESDHIDAVRDAIYNHINEQRLIAMKNMGFNAKVAAYRVIVPCALAWAVFHQSPAVDDTETNEAMILQVDPEFIKQWKY
eukprot:TRINITY_DN80172_c0_g1_i1.p1 TRINITY_DN80172_c0_g1~~TRINITY_DN80172_c0_g1_i1.p1  ORF type:complete len:112 (+),score=23.25 TRINITY_DN80172_c0_g1_i1:104-439(+)